MIALITEPADFRELRELAGKYLKYFRQRADKEGILHVIKLMKRLFHAAKCISVGSAFERIPFLAAVEGVPRLLLPFLPHLKAGGGRASVALTILSCYNFLDAESPVDLTDIQEPWNPEGKEAILEEFEKFVVSSELLAKIKAMEFKKPRIRMHTPGSQGVFGHSFYSSIPEAHILQEFPELEEAIKGLATLTGNFVLGDLLDAARSEDLKGFTFPKMVRRLEALQEPGAKRRYITIGDY